MTEKTQTPYIITQALNQPFQTSKHRKSSTKQPDFQEFKKVKAMQYLQSVCALETWVMSIVLGLNWIINRNPPSRQWKQPEER